MKRFLWVITLVVLSFSSGLAQKSPELSVEKIMQDPKIWIGTSPSNVFWSEDSKRIFFSWNPDKNKGDSLYGITLTDPKINKTTTSQRLSLANPTGIYNKSKSLKLFTRNGDIFMVDCSTLQTRQLSNTIEPEANPSFSSDEQQVIFTRNSNLFALGLSTGEIVQLSNFVAGSKKTEPKPNEQEAWLKKDQLALFDVLKERAEKKKETDKIQKGENQKRPKEIYLDDKNLDNQNISPNKQFITYRLGKSATAKSTIVPNYVTESGFTEDIPARTKVGYAFASSEFFVYNIKRDTVFRVETKSLEGMADKPNYSAKDTSKKVKADRKVIVSGPIWSEDSQHAVVVLRSVDNKDRWIARLDPEKASLKLLDRQRDEAWIGGPGIGFGIGNMGFLADNETLWYQSEADGYSHLYVVNVRTGQKKQLTSGKFEVQSVQLSKDKKDFYISTNEVHPGEQHFYRMSVAGGERIRLTNMTGANQVSLSPDESQLAILHSYSNKPWELYLQENKANSSPKQVTSSLSNEFKQYPWRDPQVITFKASDGADVPARVYVPAKPNGAAVIFVHGAGYLQNAHKWWSTYFREYQFHNLLADKGYTVLDIDYRASAGYGRNWRTGIYEFMGGRDLEDHVDGAKFLAQKYKIDPKRIGIYGGSYGGFITLMAMFTKPDVFKAGAALRPVTDWAAYNHGYTSNILNEPFTDSTAYRKSSPIYHAAGLKGHLLICHGMVDVNVHFQDAVRLAQRLIELRKENWELAAYPVEDHGFVEPTSWMDEYKRILKLFEQTLKK
jgi:dipeptidyl aminopeptidase/acylaminoacyl peptidase